MRQRWVRYRMQRGEKGLEKGEFEKDGRGERVEKNRERRGKEMRGRGESWEN